MRCNRTQAFSLAEENMPPLAFLTACRQHTQKGLAKTAPHAAIFLQVYLQNLLPDPSDESHFASSQMIEIV